MHLLKVLRLTPVPQADLMLSIGLPNRRFKYGYFGVLYATQTMTTLVRSLNPTLIRDPSTKSAYGLVAIDVENLTRKMGLSSIARKIKGRRYINQNSLLMVLLKTIQELGEEVQILSRKIGIK